MAGKKAAATRLEAAHAALRETNKKIATLDAAKVDALLADRDDQAAQCEAKAAELRRLASVQNEKIRLLQAEAEKQAAEYRAKERLAEIQRNEGTLAERDKVGAELQAVITQADNLFRRLIELGRSVDAAWSWQPHDRAPCLLPASAILEAVTHEIYRQGARPRLLGGADDAGKVYVDFPGGVCPRNEWRGVPDRITSLVDTLKVASAAASKIMRTGVSTASRDFALAEQPPISANGNGASPPVPSINVIPSPDSTPPPPAALADLLKRQNELAADTSPEGEAEYQKVVAEIARLQ
jgi:hypothetical protein